MSLPSPPDTAGRSQARLPFNPALRKLRKNNNYTYRPNENIVRRQRREQERARERRKGGGESRASDVGLGAHPENPENCLRRGLKQQ